MAAFDDRLAHSQLARLIALGVLREEDLAWPEADPKDPDPHAFLQQLPPATSTSHNRHNSHSNDGNYRHREVNAISSMWMDEDTRAFSLSAADATGATVGDRGGYDYSDASSADKDAGPRAPVWPLLSLPMDQPPPPFGTRGQAHASRRPRTPPDACAKSRGLAAFPPFAPFRGPFHVDNGVSLTRLQSLSPWFSGWKELVRGARRRRHVHAIGRRLRKRQILRRWRRLVDQGKEEALRCLRLVTWRARTVVTWWRHWTTQELRIEAHWSRRGGRRLVLAPRARLVYAWGRWWTLVAQRQRDQRRIDHAQQRHSRRLLRRVWLALAIVRFQATRDRKYCFCCFRRLKLHHDRSLSIRATSSRLHRAQSRRNVQIILRRWRRFAGDRQHERQRLLKVRHAISRGRYLDLWYRTFVAARHIRNLRARVQTRIKRDHLRAWLMARRSLEMGRHSSFWQSQSILAKYLFRWQVRSHRLRLARRATSEMNHMKKIRAVRAMRNWAHKHSQWTALLRRAIAVHRRKILSITWYRGWCSYHDVKRGEKSAFRRVRALVSGNAFRLWKSAWNRKILARNRVLEVERRFVRSNQAHSWRRWIQYHDEQKRQRANLFQAIEHHQKFCILSGLVSLSELGATRSQLSKTVSEIKRRRRHRLKNVCFLQWAGLIKIINWQEAAIADFRSRINFSNSVWNPRMMAYLKWRKYVVQRRRTHRAISLLERIKLKSCVTSWARYAKMAQRVRFLATNANLAQKKIVLSTWRERVEEWVKQRKASQLAHSVCSRRLLSKCFKVWHFHVCHYRRRIKHSESLLRQLVRAKRESYWFSNWRSAHSKQALVRGFHRISERMRMNIIFHSWRATTHQNKSLKNSLLRFQAMFGVYATTSPVKCLWKQWRYRTLIGGRVKQIARRQLMKVVASCFASLKAFRFAHVVFKYWRRWSLISASTSSDLGKRRRIFRECRNAQLMRYCLNSWVVTVKASARTKAQRVASRHQLLGDIRRAHNSRTRVRAFRLWRWFSRWRMGHSWQFYLASRHHTKKTQGRLFCAWWRFLIRSKQERVLLEARQTMSQLSLHQTVTGRANPNSSRQPASEGIQPTSSTRSQNTAKPERKMIDPKQGTGYAIMFNCRGRPSTSSDLSRPKKRFPPKLPPRGEYKVQLQSDQRRNNDARLESDRCSPTTTGIDTTRRRVTESYTGPVSTPPGMDKALIPGAPSATDLHLPVTTCEAESSNIVSLEYLAAMDPYTKLDTPNAVTFPSPTRNSSDSRDVVHVDAESQIKVIKPSNGGSMINRVEAAGQGAKTVFSTKRQPQGSKRPCVSAQRKFENLARDNCDLQELLQLQPKDGPGFEIQDYSSNMDTDQGAELNVSLVEDCIVQFYFDRLGHVQPDTSAANDSMVGILFVMFRDLKLFECGHFVVALERICKALIAPWTVPMENIIIKEKLKECLYAFIKGHPDYGVVHSGRNPIEWLVRTHLSRILTRSGLNACMSGRAAWIRHPFPSDLIATIPKLIKCIKKYKLVLEGCFSFQPEKSGAFARESPIVTKDGFAELMRHHRVFPQLFDKRELDQAVELSGSLHDNSGKTVSLNYPEFVEALIRCSTHLRWTEAHPNHGTQSTIIVVRFLMLIFAMEGKGSVLSKRSGDMKLVMGVLEQQHEQKKQEKLRRFRRLLQAKKSDLKERKKRGSSNSRHQRSIVSEQLNRSRDDEKAKRMYHNLVSEACNDSVLVVNDAVNRARDMVSPDTSHLTNSISMAKRPSHAHQDTANIASTDDLPHDVSFLASPDEYDIARTIHDGAEGYDKTIEYSDHRSVNEIEKASVTDSVALAHSNSPSDTVTVNEKPEDMKWSMMTDHHSSGIRDIAMPKDTFLDEIMASIGDVELLLEQSDVRASGQYSAPQREYAKSVNEVSEAIYRADGRWSDGVTIGHDDQSTLALDEVQVYDPLLDYLTQADRFTESPDWQSQCSLVDLAENGIHAATPASTHLNLPIQDPTLDDLTYPSSMIREVSLEEDIHDDDGVQ